MRRPKINWKVPYDKDGNMLNFAVRDEDDPLMRPNTPFKATMSVDKMETGVVSKRVVFVDQDGHRYPMFIQSLVAMLKVATVVDGKIAGMWEACRKGSNYGIKYIGGAT